ncbi:MAG: hypothetical protein ABSH51_13420 [Solirubrobacteraceae bacterium]|jgi:branched-chain amino acid transport system substrate-binding protein
MRGAALVRARAVLIAAGAAALLAGCSTAATTAVTVTGTKLTVYLSRPPAGAGQSAADVFDAEQLAFRQAGSTVGRFSLSVRTAAGAELTANARSAVSTKTTVAYLGEIEPGTSQLTVPITNELGILEVSPTDTADYLTHAVAAVGNSPGTFYPDSSTYHQTFARVVPTSAQEATALVSAMRAHGVGKLFVAPGDGSQYGDTLALEVRAAAGSAGLSVASTASGADGIFYGGQPGATATRELDALAAADAGAKLFAPSALYDDTFVAGLSPAAQAGLYVSSPGFMPSALSSAARQFEASFASAYGHDPVPEAIFGAETVEALVAVIQQAGVNAGQRALIVADFRSLKNRASPLIGTYSIAGGDTSIAPFIIARVKNGALVPAGSA